MKLVDAMTMMIQGHVELESGHQCMLLVNDIQNHNEMEDKAGSVTRTDVESTRRTPVGQRGLVCQQVCGESEEQEESRVERNLGETKSKIIAWRTREERIKWKLEAWIEKNTSRLRRIRAPRRWR